MPSLETAIGLVDEKQIIDFSRQLIRVPSVTGDEKNVVLLARGIRKLRSRYTPLRSTGATYPHSDYKP